MVVLRRCHSRDSCLIAATVPALRSGAAKRIGKAARSLPPLTFVVHRYLPSGVTVATGLYDHYKKMCAAHITLSCIGRVNGRRRGEAAAVVRVSRFTTLTSSCISPTRANGRRMNSRLRIAIVHDWLYVLGGAEKVLKGMLSCFPSADVFCLFDVLSERGSRLDRLQAGPHLLLPAPPGHPQTPPLVPAPDAACGRATRPQRL